ncbi:MAG: 3-hydroxyisobutyryl-CoA hydrolase [Devosia sp.]
MTGQLEVFREGHLGVIALNRPEAINALSLDMIGGITRTLEQWLADNDIHAVLFEGRGPRGFCAGGDVRAVRQLVLDGRADEADAYFAAEYAMNDLIAGYAKPTVALTHGVVMGGGIGIAGHCSYRFTTPDAKFAMPEAAIGFVSDVGVNAVLAKAPLHRALLFLMSGVAVGPADALALGLADCIYDPARRETVLAAIVTAASAASPDTALTHLAQAEMIAEGDAPFAAYADAHQELRWSEPDAIMAGVTDGPIAAALHAGSPASLLAIHASHLAARQLATTGEVLAIDLELARLFCRRPDFAEGVRAVLVDKDRQPKWNRDDLFEISAAIAAATGPKLV